MRSTTVFAFVAMLIGCSFLSCKKSLVLPKKAPILLTQADLAVWDALDSIVTWIEGAKFGAFGRVEKFYEAIRARPAIAEYLASDRRLGEKPKPARSTRARSA